MDILMADYSVLFYQASEIFLLVTKIIFQVFNVINITSDLF